jgi:hypothetical protein
MDMHLTLLKFKFVLGFVPHEQMKHNKKNVQITNARFVNISCVMFEMTLGRI